ncbi:MULTISPECIES: glutamate 5-kinase [Fusobacterium]|jgi:glutamate 5-kinase|uniref:glutamate 5-kinase n=1 Tax=Fusobacterium TaxID=848 RepID=UPI000C7003FE|nr:MULTISPECIES: glutamate 5-kinase [Fusobacterium]
MENNIRQRIKDSKRIVVKVGTSTLTYPNGNLNLNLINRLSWVLADLRNQDKEVILVTSGAIGVGSKSLNFEKRPTITREKQAAAAVGQVELMHIYQNFLGEYNQRVAQVLLTKEDFKAGERRTNTNNTLETLLDFGVIPIINANDTISTFEIEFSDNDRLSASVAALLQSDLLIILTDIDALYDANPKTHPEAKRIPYVEKVTDDILSMGGEKGSEFSVGGMETKLLAARTCYDHGVIMAILNGSNPLLIQDLMDQKDVGTVFDCKK